MYVDNEVLLSKGQALTSTAYSTNTIDLASTSPARDVGAGTPMALVVAVTVSADAASGNETYQFQAVQSANADLSSHDVLAQTDTAMITRTMLVQGYIVVLPIPPNLISKRYLGARYVLGGTTPSITVTSFIAPMVWIDVLRQYAKGFTIS